MALHDTDLSFDPRDPYFPVPGGSEVEWAVQVFTTDNGYGLDADRAQVGTTADGVRVRCDRYARLGQQVPAGSGEVEVQVREDDVLEWVIEVSCSEPIKSVKLLLRGLPEEPLRRGWWTPSTGRGWTHGADLRRFQLEYPGPDWPTPWVAAGDEAGGLVLAVRDPQLHRQILHVHRPSYATGPVVELVHVPAASARTTSYRVPPVRLRPSTTPSTVDSDLREHMSFVEESTRLETWDSRDDVPDWLRDVALVVTLHGQHWTGYVFNDFARMAEELRFVAQHIPPHRVLAYLTGWEGRYYHDYPQYRPGADLGGEAGFAELVDTAHRLGMHVMPMFGGHGANVNRYPAWEQAVIRNDTNRYVELLNRPDWDSDRIGEGDQVFLNPGEPGFRNHLVRSILALVRDFGIDAAFLDTLGYWFNDPRFPLLNGYRQLAAELHHQAPHLVLATEGWWDALMAIFPLCQQWLGVDRDLRKPWVLTDYARTTGHLAEGTPGPGSTGVHEKGFLPRPPDVARPGHIPVLGFADTTLEQHAEEVAEICRWAAEHAPAAELDQP